MRLSSLSLLFVLTISAGSSLENGLFRAIGSDDLMALRASIEAGADLDAQGPMGAAPLHYAVAVGSPEAVSILLQAGAAVNGRSALDATPLHWAAGDVVKTRLLVEAGANVHARSKAGRVPILAAAAQNGASEAVRLLLESGSDPNSADDNGTTPLLAAALAGDLRSVQLLLGHKADPKQADKSGYTPLHFAAGNGDLSMVKLLLSCGAPVNVANTFGGAVRHGDITLKGLTPLMLAVPATDASVVEALLEAGADVNARDVRGMTPLMLAAASEHRDPRTIKLLLDRRAAVDTVSAHGESALDWALKYGDPSAIQALQRAGAPRSRTAGDHSAPTAAPARDARQAAEAGLALVQRSADEFFRQSGCVGCHHQNMAQIAVSAARQAELSFDESAAKRSVEATAAQWSIFAPGQLERLDAPGSPDTPTFSLFSLAMSQHPADTATDALFANIAAQQRFDGSWRMAGFSRAPMEESAITRTAMAVRALQAYAPRGRGREMRERSQRAGAFLLSAKPRTTDEYVWRLLGLRWTNSASKEVRRAAKKLLALQRADGGWAPIPNLPSDAFATGTALWALYTSDAAQPDDEVYKRGVAYLLSSQQPDGSWLARSRAPKFQPYFESGFPHGPDQWISIAATSWAVAAIVPATQRPTATD